jgi:hypothetical protein
LFGTLEAHGLRMRRELTLAVKALTQSEELMRAIAPELPLVDAAAQEAEGLLREHLTPERLAGMAQREIARAVEQVITRPDAIGRIIPALLGQGLPAAGGSFVGEVVAGPRTAAGDPPPGRSLDEISHRLVTVLGLGAICLALGLLTLALALGGDLIRADMAQLAPVALGAAMILLASLLWRWRSTA